MRGGDSFCRVPSLDVPSLNTFLHFTLQNNAGYEPGKLVECWYDYEKENLFTYTKHLFIIVNLAVVDVTVITTEANNIRTT